MRIVRFEHLLVQAGRPFANGKKAHEKSVRFIPLRWAESFYTIAPVMMGRVLKVACIDKDSLVLLLYVHGETVDPNVNRKRLLSPWVTAANFQGLDAVK
jgi:hypothetical protein